MSKESGVESSLSEKPGDHRPRRLADWLNPSGKLKVHSLVDKIYKMKNLELAWAKVKANQGSGGADGVSLEEFEKNLSENLQRLHEELKQENYHPQAVRLKQIPKPGQPGKYRELGIPNIYDRVCQQAILNRLEPIFEPLFDEANFGYRRGRSTKDALSKVWREIKGGNEWIVDADLKNFFGIAEHDKLLTLLNQQISDGRVLRIIESMLKAGKIEEGQRVPSDRGTAQGSVISPLLSNLSLTPFDREMRKRGYALTRYADDWVVTCATRSEAQSALKVAKGILEKLGVVLHEGKTRIVLVQVGFEFLGYKIKRGKKPLDLAEGKIKSKARQGKLYAYPKEQSIQRFKEQIRRRTRRKAPLSTE